MSVWTTNLKPPTVLNRVLNCGPDVLVLVVVHPLPYFSMAGLGVNLASPAALAMGALT